MSRGRNEGDEPGFHLEAQRQQHLEAALLQHGVDADAAGFGVVEVEAVARQGFGGFPQALADGLCDAGFGVLHVFGEGKAGGVVGGQGGEVGVGVFGEAGAVAGEAGGRGGWYGGRRGGVQCSRVQQDCKQCACGKS
jgi:hypothetical protein